MTPLEPKDHTNESVPSLTIGCDLKVTDCNHAWRNANLPGATGAIRQRIDGLFPGSDVGGYVLKALLSGEPRENVVISLGGPDRGRYLWANFHPLPAGAGPRKVQKVLMQAWETNTRLLVDRVIAPVPEPSNSSQESRWRSMPSMTEQEFEKALAAAEKKDVQLAGLKTRRGSDGKERELETLLPYLDGSKC